MPFQPGQSGNPGGRTPGSKNRDTRFMDTIEEYLNQELADVEDLKTMLADLSTKDRMKFITEVMPYFVAKKKEVDMNHSFEDAPQITIKKYGDKKE